VRFTTRARYGVRLMIDLSQHYGQGPVFLKDIARRQDVSERYLANIVQVLKKKGMVHSFRGVHGGYVLAKKPVDITLKDIVCSLEKQAHLVGCVHKLRFCSRANSCQARRVWMQVEKCFYSALASITLKNACKKCRMKPLRTIRKG